MAYSEGMTVEQLLHEHCRVVARNAGGMVRLAVSLQDPDLAYSLARRGTSGARMLGWWRESADVPQEAFDNAALEDLPKVSVPAAEQEV